MDQEGQKECHLCEGNFLRHGSYAGHKKRKEKLKCRNKKRESYFYCQLA